MPGVRDVLSGAVALMIDVDKHAAVDVARANVSAAAAIADGLINRLEQFFAHEAEMQRTRGQAGKSLSMAEVR